MARFTIVFEDGKINKKLEFQNNIFEYTMEPFEYGMKGNKPSILDQFEDRFGYMDTEEELADHLNSLDFGNEDEVRQAIEYLDYVE